MLRTFSGHLTELQALVLKGAPGKWLFSQWNLPLEPSVAEWSFCPGGRGGEESGEGEPSPPRSRAVLEEFRRAQFGNPNLSFYIQGN